MNLTPDERRIRAALEQIETPMYDISAAVREQRARRSRRIPLRSPQRILASVLAAILLTMTAAAAVMQLSGGWHAIFGQGVAVPEEITVPLQSSQTVDGCTVTLEDAIVSSSSIAAIFSVQMADGTALKDRVEFGDIQLSIDGSALQTPHSIQTVYDQEHSEIQYSYQEYEYNGQTQDNPSEINLTFVVGPISRIENPAPLTAQIDLSALYQAQPLTLTEEGSDADREAAYAQQDFSAVSLPLDYRAPNIRFAGMSFRGDCLYLALSYPEDGASAEVSSLLDTRTGETIACDSGGSFGRSDSSVRFYETGFPGITADDLPYLQPQISYTFPIQLTHEALTFSFSTEPVAAYARDLDLYLADGTRISHISISPIGIQLTGTCPVENDDQQPEISVMLRDGSIIGTNACAIGITTSDGAEYASFDATYEYKAGDFSRRFLPLSDIAAVTIGQTTIRIEE